MRRRSIVSTVAIYIALTFASMLVLVPLIWLIPTAFKSVAEIFSAPLSLLPSSLRWQNFTDAWGYAPFGRYYVNTIVITFGLLLVQIITITLAAYAFARVNFPGRNVLFLMFLTQLMITPQTTILPNYMTISALGLLDTRIGVAMPYFASAFGVFLMRQAFLSIPNNLEEAAFIDGANVFQTMWFVLLPLTKPSLIAFSIFSVTSHWNEFFWPLVVTETAASRPLTVGLAMFAQQAEGGAEWGLLMAATLIVALPLLVAFIIFQRQFIQSFIASGLKG